MARVRTGSGRLLPAIRSSYHEEFNDPSDREIFPTPRQGVESRAISRFEDFEGRLYAQEKTTKSLIERAYKIKEDIIDNLNITQETWLEEKRSRELLQEHIRTITDVVRKLNRDITTIDNEIKQKEAAIGGTQDNVKTLEMHHVAGLTDVRGRVARADAAISRLSADIKGCFDSVRNLGNQQQENNSRILERLGNMDTKVNELFTRLEKTYTENEIHLKHLESDTGQKMTGLDSKTRTWLEEMRNSLNTFKAIEVNEREKLEARLVNHIDRVLDSRDVRMEKFEKQTENHVAELNKLLTMYDDAFRKEKEKTSHSLKTLESKMATAFDNQSRKQSSDTERLKREFREGFATVHESITNMKHVMDGKRKLLEEQIKKEIGQIRKMVVLI